MPSAIPAVIGLVAAGSSAKSQRKSAQGAAAVQQQSAAEATAEQRRQFDITQQQATPFREAGVEALGQERALLGLAGQPAQAEAFQSFQESPGQAFLRQRGEQSLLRNQSAIGGLGGGNVKTALVEQGVGFAQQDLQNQLQRLSALRTGGQAVTSGLAGQRASMASNVGNLATQAGQAQAQGILGAGQAQQQFTNRLGAIGVGAAAGSGLAGQRTQQAFGGSTGAGALLGLL